MNKQTALDKSAVLWYNKRVQFQYCNIISRGENLNLTGQLIVFVILFVVIAYLMHIKNSNEAEIVGLKTNLFNTQIVLGYYRVRFGHVTPEDIENSVGVTDEMIEKAQRAQQEE